MMYLFVYLRAYAQGAVLWGLCQASGIHISCSISPHRRLKAPLLLSCMIIHTVSARAFNHWLL